MRRPALVGNSLGDERLPVALTRALLGLAVALLVALAFAASANAAEASGEQPAGGTVAGAEGQPQGTPTGEEQSTTPAPSSPPVEATAPTTAAPEETSTAPTPEEPVTTQSSPEGEAAQTVPTEGAQTVPPVEQVLQPPSEEATQVVAPEETAGPILVSEEVSAPSHGVEEVLVKSASLEEAKTPSTLEETTIVGRGASGSSSAGQDSSSQASTAVQSTALTSGAEGTVQPAAGALIGSLAAGTEGGPRVPPSSGGGTPKLSTGAALASGGNDLACTLASLEHRISGLCSGWLSTQRVLSTSTLAAVMTAGSSPSQTGTSDGGSRSPSVESAPPSSTTPGPPPAGAGGAAAAGGSGMALGFLSLAGLLLLAAPLAMRRLRLSFRLWRASCVALIPERPG